MYHPPIARKLYQAIITTMVLGMTTACESESKRQAMLNEAEINAAHSEQRAVAAEARMKELVGKVQEAETAKTKAIKARQAVEQELGKAKGEVTFHTALNVIFFSLTFVAFFAGVRQGEGRKKDNDAIRNSMSDDPYIEMYGPATNVDIHKLRSDRS
jgi:hypothetical protein